MDAANALYQPLRDLYARTVGLGTQLRAALEREPSVRYAFVFGSYARGDDDVRSDVDVFIVGEVRRESLLRRLQELEATLRRDISPIVWSDSELTARVRERAPFLMTVLAEPKIWLLGDEDEFETRTREMARSSSRARPRDRSRSRGRESEAPPRRTQSRTGARARRRRS